MNYRPSQGTTMETNHRENMNTESVPLGDKGSPDFKHRVTSCS